jgi:hypothetical protein
MRAAAAVTDPHVWILENVDRFIELDRCVHLTALNFLDVAAQNLFAAIVLGDRSALNALTVIAGHLLQATYGIIGNFIPRLDPTLVLGVSLLATIVTLQIRRRVGVRACLCSVGIGSTLRCFVSSFIAVETRPTEARATDVRQRHFALS